MFEDRFVVPEATAPRRAATPTFSIVIAAYQATATIRDALESAFAQTLPPSDVVVCDDGSTDGLAERIADYADRVKLIRQENLGEAAAKNAAVGEARGEYVAILDADDVYLPERLHALADLATARPDLDILTTDAFLEIGGRVERRCYDRGWTFEVAAQRRTILERNFIFGLAAVRRRSLLDVGGFDESLRYATDWDCWIRLIVRGCSAGLVDEPLARYRLRPDSLSAQRPQLLRGRAQVLERAAANPELTSVEKSIVRRTLGRANAEAAIAEAREALLERAADARGRALRVVVTRGAPPLTRARAIAAAIAPRLAARTLSVDRGRPGPADVWFEP